MLANARDVGGLTTDDGRRVRAGVLFRSDAPHPGDAAPPLTPWPPQWVIDLRSPGEAGGADHPLAATGAEIRRLPLLSVADPLRMAAAIEEEGASLMSIYEEVVRAAAPVVAEVAAIVAASDGPVLVHCTAGKDRTGVVVAALLAAAGVSDEQIAADYVATGPNMDAVVERIGAAWPADVRAERLARLRQGHGEILTAPRAAIDAVLDSVRAHGLGEDDGRALRARLLD